MWYVLFEVLRAKVEFLTQFNVTQYGKKTWIEYRDVPDTTLLDTGINRIVIYRIPDSSMFKQKS